MSKKLFDRMMQHDEPEPEQQPEPEAPAKVPAPNRLPCPKCGSRLTRVRRTFGDTRYRECCHCKHPFKTIESA